MDRKITRKEFLKFAGFGVLTLLILPKFKKFNLFNKRPHDYKEAKYYKKLAG